MFVYTTRHESNQIQVMCLFDIKNDIKNTMTTTRHRDDTPSSATKDFGSDTNDYL